MKTKNSTPAAPENLVERALEPARRLSARLRGRADLDETRANDAHDLRCYAAGVDAAARLIEDHMHLAMKGKP